MRTLLLLLFLLPMISCFAVDGNKVDTLPKGYGQRFSKQQIEADLAFMVHAMENAHPNLYHSISKERYIQLKDSMVATWSDSMTRNEAWPSFAKMIAAIDEGHTAFGNAPELKQEVVLFKKPIFPLLIQSFDGKAWVVKKDYSPNPVLKKGDRITKINGHKVDSLMQVLATYYGGLQHWRYVKVVDNLIRELYRFQIRAPFQIEYTGRGEKKQCTYSGITLEELSKAANAANQYNQEPFTFERLKNNIGYINFRAMDMKYGPRFDTFLLKTFTELKQKPTQALIIDLRENGGGDSKLGYNLLQLITEQPFRMSGGVIWKVSQEYKDYINTMDSTRKSNYDFYFAKQNGEFFSGADDPAKPENNPLRYKGKVCFLIGNQTFSSANMLAATVKDYKLATLIGEMSGERPNDYGDILSMKLPNTGMDFYTSTKQFVRPNGDKNDMNPVLPDIHVKQNPVSKQDDVLQRAIQWVQKGM